MNNVKSNLSSESLNVILNILNEIKYGTLTLVVQDGKVIQIERSEKIRV
ncbi:MAG: YezD family protein [Clostridium sp.]|uniref:YezD family protein n=1 Tax=Clostridium saudiense TaxID=1414720 RepID=A0ABS2FJU3_9CLOT|nr:MULTISPECIES: YezD family protein [Clostridiaceae]MBM6820860.1 YezD family protein [Clostridium saudiense]MBQ8998228.1 YezD family protein [Clostridium sp.]